jgi:hypothetical protein
MNRTAYALAGATLLYLAAAGGYAQRPENKKSKLRTASQPTLYRLPSSFTQLPYEVALDLERRGCRIPQQADTRAKTNVIRGEFARAGQMDWAVLCSIHGVSRILVYWDGSGRSPADVAHFEDRNYLEEDARGRFQLQRGIDAVGKEFILRHYRAYRGHEASAN